MDLSQASGLPMLEDSNPLKAVGKQQLDRDDFMTLFITQLQYQDPMKPMDSYEMASQLAQFSNMEATMRMSDNMEKLLDFQTSQNNLQLLTLLDKEVQTFGNEIAVNEGVAGSGEFTLVEPAATCQVEVYDAAGNFVRQIDLGYMKVGTYDLAWDGENSGGEQVDDGLYGYKVKAMNELGVEVEVETRTTGKVTGVRFDSGRAELTLDNYVAIDVAQVVQVVEPTVAQ